MPSRTHPADLPPGTTSEDLDDVMMPEMRDEEAARVRPIREAPAGLHAVLPRNRGGRPRLPDAKVHVSLRVDADVLAAYKATGAGWQTRINDTLRRGAARLGKVGREGR